MQDAYCQAVVITPVVFAAVEFRRHPLGMGTGGHSQQPNTVFCMKETHVTRLVLPVLLRL